MKYETIVKHILKVYKDDFRDEGYGIFKCDVKVPTSPFNFTIIVDTGYKITPEDEVSCFYGTIWNETAVKVTLKSRNYTTSFLLYARIDKWQLHYHCDRYDDEPYFVESLKGKGSLHDIEPDHVRGLLDHGFSLRRVCVYLNEEVLTDEILMHLLHTPRTASAVKGENK